MMVILCVCALVGPTSYLSTLDVDGGFFRISPCKNLRDNLSSIICVSANSTSVNALRHSFTLQYKLFIYLRNILKLCEGLFFHRTFYFSLKYCSRNNIEKGKRANFRGVQVFLLLVLTVATTCE